MYFYLYHLEVNSSTLSLYGREFLVTGEVDLNTIHNSQSRVRAISFSKPTVPHLYICKENVSTEEEINLAIDELKEELKITEKDVGSFEILKLKNIFYEDLNEDVTAIRSTYSKKLNLTQNQSFYFNRVIPQFANQKEHFLISKNIKGPCLLKIDLKEDYIVYNQFKKVIVESFDSVTVLGKIEMPKLNFCSIAFKYQKNTIESFSLCINGIKLMCGTKDNNGELKTIKNGSNVFKTYSNEQRMILDIQGHLDSLQIDIIVVYNIPNAILQKFNFERFLFCDFYSFALGTVKARDYSLKDLSEYFNYTPHKYSFSFYRGEDFAMLSNEAKTIYELYILSDALLLSKELAEISGCIINMASSNNRAKIIDFALIHELYERKYLFPKSIKHTAKQYTGGKVLVPNIGPYTSAILLLDFNSLYPSIIQEYNVCFSTIGKQNVNCLNFQNEEDFEALKPIENDLVSSKKGFLPIIISNLVLRRKEVKKLIKNGNGNNKIYDLRQKALKLLANSIYGCLGFPSSRFCNYTMAAFITKKGRDLLVEARNIVTNELGYNVIYGDTDSIMINTQLKYCDENIQQINKMAEEIKSKINLKYKNIEIDLDRIFIRLFLYTKKRYAGLFVTPTNTYKKEYKGIDTVRRDVCKATIDILNSVLDILLDHTKPLEFEKTRGDVLSVLHEESLNLRSRPVEDFVINVGLSKPLELYDIKAPLPHVHLANRLKQEGVYFDQQDMVSFVIYTTEKKEPAYQRAFLPTEPGQIDYDYYVSNQILPSLLRTVRITNFITNEDLQRVFGCKTSSSHSQNISTHSIQFITQCCNSIQDPGKICLTCKTTIDEDFYFNKVKEMINKEISCLYKSSPMCIDCNQRFDNLQKICKFCSSHLFFKPENEEFNVFIDNLMQSFQNTDFNQVKRFIKMHFDHSSFKIFDLSVYFSQEMANYNKRN